MWTDHWYLSQTLVVMYCISKQSICLYSTISLSNIFRNHIQHIQSYNPTCIQICNYLVSGYNTLYIPFYPFSLFSIFIWPPFPSVPSVLQNVKEANKNSHLKRQPDIQVYQHRALTYSLLTRHILNALTLKGLTNWPITKPRFETNPRKENDRKSFKLKPLAALWIRTWQVLSVCNSCLPDRSFEVNREKAVLK